MNPVVTRAFAAAILAAAACSAGDAPAPEHPLAVDPSAFSGANALRHVDQLAGTIGPRAAGSDQERTAAAYLAAQLTGWGYEVTQQPFSFTTVVDHSGLRIITGEAAEVQAALVTNAAQGTVRGPLYDAGLGTALAPGSLRGRVALLERGELGTTDKVGAAARAGATAALIFNNVPGRYYSFVRNAVGIPALTISRDDGLRLRQALGAGEVLVEVRARSEVVTRRSQNVVAQAGPGCAVIVGGHYDSIAEGAGANDNASGTGTTLEAARVLAPVAAAGKLCFVAFGAEEAGVHGSRSFVDELSAAERSAIVAMINIDMVGAGTNWADRVGLRTGWRITGDSSLARVARGAARRLRLWVKTRIDTVPGAGNSDHASFTRIGIPSLFIHLNNDAMYHTPQDTPERVDPANLQAAGMIVVVLAQVLMNVRR